MKRSKNLFLDPEAIRRGEQYSRLYRTNLSMLVNNYLMSLPVEGERLELSLSPAVRRLLGAASGASGVDDYRGHLLEKFGG